MGLNTLIQLYTKFRLVMAQSKKYEAPSENQTHYPYLPTPPLRQDMTQGQFLSRV